MSSGFDYSNLIAVATDLIRRFGRDLVYKQKATTVFDPVTGVESGKTFNSYNTKAVFFPASAGTIQAFDNRFLEEHLQGKIRFCLVSGETLPIEALPGDEAEFDGQTWEVIGNTPVYPGNDLIIHRIGLRKK